MPARGDQFADEGAIFAASSLRWKGCGSNSRANAMISSRVMRTRGAFADVPSTRSSKIEFGHGSTIASGGGRVRGQFANLKCSTSPSATT